jgi:hypothetical protein
MRDIKRQGEGSSVKWFRATFVSLSQDYATSRSSRNLPARHATPAGGSILPAWHRTTVDAQTSTVPLRSSMARAAARRASVRLSQPAPKVSKSASDL